MMNPFFSYCSTLSILHVKIIEVPERHSVGFTLHITINAKPHQEYLHGNFTIFSEQHINALSNFISKIEHSVGAERPPL